MASSVISLLIFHRRGKKHSIILRTQLSVRVHACIGEYKTVPWPKPCVCQLTLYEDQFVSLSPYRQWCMSFNYQRIILPRSSLNSHGGSFGKRPRILIWARINSISTTRWKTGAWRGARRRRLGTFYVSGVTVFCHFVLLGLLVSLSNVRELAQRGWVETHANMHARGMRANTHTHTCCIWAFD